MKLYGGEKSRYCIFIMMMIITSMIVETPKTDPYLTLLTIVLDKKHGEKMTKNEFIELIELNWFRGLQGVEVCGPNARAKATTLQAKEFLPSTNIL